MKLNLRVLMAAIAVMALAACAQNTEQHAPVCPYGQALAYTDAGYSCDFVSLVPPGFNTLQAQQNVAAPEPGSVLTPPVQSCGSDPNQVLIDWRGTWLCYFNQTIYPSGGNSPQLPTPPPGIGGEFCTSVGMSGVGYYPYSGVTGTTNPYSYMSNMVVTCSPGFSCQPSNSSTTSNSYNPYGMGFGYGQAGTCQYTGYHGSY